MAEPETSERGPELDPGLADLLAASRTGGQAKGEGRFRLDWSRALDKIKRFQLADPHRYVLELIQAAVAAGATFVEVATDADDVILSFDGAPLSGEELGRIFDYLFVRERGLSRLQQLALGINACLALSPKFVLIESGDGRSGARARLRTHLDLELTLLEGEEAPAGTRIQVRDRLSWQVVRDALGSETAEVRILRESCSFSPIPVRVNGQDVRRPFDEDTVLTYAFSLDGIRGEVALPMAVRSQTRVELCMNGVSIATRTFDEPMGILARVDNPALTRNASHSDVVQNKEVEHTVRVVGRACRTLLERYLQCKYGGAPDVPRTAAAAGDTSYLPLAAYSRLRAGRKDPLPIWLERLLDEPDLVLLAVGGPRSPLRPLWEAFQRDGVCRVSWKRFAGVRERDLPSGWVVASGPAFMLRAVFAGKLKEVEAELAALERGAQIRLERERDRREPMLRPGSCVRVLPVQLDDPPIKGEIGLPLRLAHGGVIVDFLCEGVPLAQKALPPKSVACLAVLDSPQFAPTPTWDDVQKNAASEAAAKLLIDALPSLLELLLIDYPELPPPESLRRRQKWSPEQGDPDDDEKDAKKAKKKDRRCKKQKETETEASLEELVARDRESERQLHEAEDVDPGSAMARRHLDALLATLPKLERDAAPWLWSWPIFTLLDQTPVSLDRIRHLSGQDGGAMIRWVVESSWGPGIDGPVLNLSRRQRDLLERYLGALGPCAKRELTVARKALVRDAELQRTRRENLAVAELQRGKNRLRSEDYLALIELPAELGRGQIGVPVSADASWVRFLVDDLPVCERKLENPPFPVHAVVEAEGLRANATFDEVEPEDKARAVARRLRTELGTLAAALARCGSVSEQVRGHLWTYLAQLPQAKGSPADPLPVELQGCAIVPTVAHGHLSLRELRELASSGRPLRRVDGPASRQLSEPPILVCHAKQSRILARLIGAKITDYSAELQAEERVLEKLDRPRQRPVLDDGIALKVAVRGPELEGELGFARLDRDDGAPLARVRVLRDGVPIEVRQLSLRQLPLIGIVSSPRFTPSPRWDSVIADKAFQDALAALREAADRLVMKACEQIREGAHAGEVGIALQRLAASELGGRSLSALEPSSELERALFDTPLWECADGAWVSLGQISSSVSSKGRLLLVQDLRGHPAPGRLILVSPADSTDQGLRRLFGSAVEDGTAILAADEAAYQRRTTAPRLEPRLESDEVLIRLRVRHTAVEEAMEMVGELGIPAQYQTAEQGIAAAIAIDGRLLCRVTLEHPLGAVAVIDCAGLRPSDDWRRVEDPNQLAVIRQVLEERLWECVRQTARRADSLDRQRPADESRRLLLLEAYAHLSASATDPDLCFTLRRAPLLRTVEGRAVSAAELGEGEVRVVSERCPGGSPGDGRLILRADEATLGVLTTLLGQRLARHDQEWRAELEGQERRRAKPSVPAVNAECAALTFFSEGGTSGVAGLLRPRAGAGCYDDSADQPGEVRLHIDRRRVQTRPLETHPGIEVWLNDDRLQPTSEFTEVREDERLARALELARAQIPELLARAAERWCGNWAKEGMDPLRLRLCRYVMDRRAALEERTASSPRGPEARLLRAPLWRSSHGKLVSTEEVLTAANGKRLATLRQDPDCRPETDWPFLVVAGTSERDALAVGLGEVPDWTEELALRGRQQLFLKRPATSRVDLNTARIDRRMLLRRRFETEGLRGEIGFPAVVSVDSGIEAHLHAKGRSLGVRLIPAAFRAVAAVDADLLTLTYDEEGFEEDDAYFALADSLLTEAAALLAQLVTSWGSLPLEDWDAARRVLLQCAGALSRGRGEADRQLADTIWNLPLLADVSGGLRSVTELRHEAETRKAVAFVGPGAPVGQQREGERIFLRLERTVAPVLRRFVPLEDGTTEYAASLELARRQAETPLPEVDWSKTLASAVVHSASFRGDLALGVPPGVGELWLVVRGVPVSKLSASAYRGLTGFIHGETQADATFTKAVLTEGERREIAQMYQARLEAALELATSRSPGADDEYQALAGYAAMVIARWLASQEGAARSVDASLFRERSLPEAVRRAVQLPIFEHGDGSWIDVMGVLERNAAVLVISERRVSASLEEGALLLVCADELRRSLLERLMGGKRVMSYGLWRASRGSRAAERAERAAEEDPSAAADRRTLIRLQSVLSELLKRGARLGLLDSPAVSRMRAVALASARLVNHQENDVWTGPWRLELNTRHAVWQTARGLLSGADGQPRAALHLTAAVLAELRLPGLELLDLEQTISALTALADLALSRASAQDATLTRDSGASAPGGAA